MATRVSRASQVVSRAFDVVSKALVVAKKRPHEKKKVVADGFGVANPVGKQSRVARPVKRQKNAAGGLLAADISLT